MGAAVKHPPSVLFINFMTRRKGEIKIAYRGIRLKEQHPKIAAQIAENFDLSPIAARVLAARGFKPDRRLKDFISPTLKEGLPDPRELKNLSAACELIADTAKAKQPVAICCDFDVDGLSGGAQLQLFLQQCQIPSKVFVPDRFLDGYGLNEKIIRNIAAEGFGLLIAVDYGTRSAAELDLARNLALKTIVIDHHHVGDSLTPADVFINPQQKDCGFADGLLCASGLVWYLLCGLRKTLPQAAHLEARSFLDLACLGTICDMVPLVGANRVIAKRGLEILAETGRPGLRALKNICGIGKKVSCSHVSFGIGPRLNAAGRMVNAQMVIELLITSSSDRADKLARKLNLLNLERQEMENQTKEHAIEQVKALERLPNGIALWDSSYHTGVIGLVAQRLVEAFYRPAAVMGLDTDGVYKGSVRGIRGFNVVEALGGISGCLLKYGGHEGAGGFSVEESRLEEFRDAFDRECSRRLQDIDTEPFSEADAEAELLDISPELVREFESFSPFGMGNPGPLILIKDLQVKDVRVLKDTHLKTVLTDGRNQINGLMWRQNFHPALFPGARVCIACKPDLGTFNGLSELQLNLQAVELQS